MNHDTQLFDRPLLTENDLRNWRKERSELTADVDKKNKRIEELSKLIGAASLFVRRDIPDESEEEIEPESLRSSADEMPLPELILLVLKEAEDWKTLKQTRVGVKGKSRVWRDKIRSNPNYFYTVLKRLVDREQVVREGDKFRIK
mgnify:CR=1 FL=1